MKKWFGICALFLLGICLLACKEEGQGADEQQNIQVYYINRDETAIVPVSYELKATETTDAVSELLLMMKTEPEEKDLKATIFASIGISSCRILEGRLIIDFDKAYKEMPATTEVLVRAAIVRTVTQIEGLDMVEFEVAGEPLIDSAGILVGTMNAGQFIDNEGSEINVYEEVVLKLYFANEEGTALVPVECKVEYNTNVPVEKLVMEQLIAGPNTVNAYPTVNPATKIINVTVNDGTCYLNVDQTFLTQVYTVNSDVAIYSVVNSLVELENVNKVQILVNGESEISYRESMNLNTTFGRNLDLVEEEAPETEP